MHKCRIEGIIVDMRWLLILLLFPALALAPAPLSAGEDCAGQLGGKCKEACAPDEAAEQGAFLDCTGTQKCCVRKEAPKASAASSVVVLLDQMAFSPEVIKVKAGTEVRWRNNDSSVHTVTADDGSFSSGPLEQGGEFRKQFTKPGTYSYTCEMHPFMTGKVVVE
jgi:plastocyanin